MNGDHFINKRTGAKVEQVLVCEHEITGETMIVYSELHKNGKKVCPLSIFNMHYDGVDDDIS